MNLESILFLFWIYINVYFFAIYIKYSRYLEHSESNFQYN